MISTGAHLRYGVVVDRPALSRWQVQVLGALDRVDGVECAGAHVLPPAAGSPVLPAAWRLVERMSSGGTRADTRATAARTLPLVGSRPDVWLHLGSGAFETGPGLDAPLGVWRFFIGQAEVGRDATAGLAEILADEPLTRITVRRVDPGGRGIVLAAATLSTVPHSLGRNRDQALAGAVELPAQICRRMVRSDDEPGPDLPATEPPLADRSPAIVVPTGTLAARAAIKLSANWGRRQLRGLTQFDRWHVGYVDRPISSFVDRPGLDDVVWLPRPDGDERYVADPFACPDGDAWVVLVEDYDHAGRHGRISSYRLEADGSCGRPGPVAEFAGHASYPFLCQVGDEWWCVPETSAAREVRAHRFRPDSLELDDVGALLGDVALADPTLFEWQSRWWLFGTDRDQGANSHLRAWWSDNPRGPWTRHTIDPLLVDVRSARGAGTPFVHEGRLHRPAQDCSTSYGGAVTLTRIDRLDPATFSQTVVGRLVPSAGSDYPDGVHTLSAMGERTLVDAAVRRFSMPGFLHEVTARVRVRLPVQGVRSSTLERTPRTVAPTGTRG